jgi:hypothetical protein
MNPSQIQRFHSDVFGVPHNLPGRHLTNEQFFAFADGTLSEVDLDQHEAHLRQCPECNALLARLIMASHSQDEPLPEGVRPPTLASILAATQPKTTDAPDSEAGPETGVLQFPAASVVKQTPIQADAVPSAIIYFPNLLEMRDLDEAMGEAVGQWQNALSVNACCLVTPQGTVSLTLHVRWKSHAFRVTLILEEAPEAPCLIHWVRHPRTGGEESVILLEFQGIGLEHKLQHELKLSSLDEDWIFKTHP